MTEKQCAWVEDSYGNWNTSCGEIFVFDDSNKPSDHSFEFCCFCGCALKEVVFEEVWDD